MSAAHCWLVSRVPSSWYLFGNYTRVYMCSCLSISITLRRETNSAEANSPNHARVQQGRCGCNASVCCRCQYRVRMSKGGGLEREGEGRTHRETEFRGGSRPKWQLRLPIPLSDEAGASGGSRWPLQFCRGRLRGLGATRGRGSEWRLTMGRASRQQQMARQTSSVWAWEQSHCDSRCGRGAGQPRLCKGARIVGCTLRHTALAGPFGALRAALLTDTA